MLHSSCNNTSGSSLGTVMKSCRACAGQRFDGVVMHTVMHSSRKVRGPSLFHPYRVQQGAKYDSSGERKPLPAPVHQTRVVDNSVDRCVYSPGHAHTESLCWIMVWCVPHTQWAEMLATRQVRTQHTRPPPPSAQCIDTDTGPLIGHRHIHKSMPAFGFHWPAQLSD